MLRWLDTWMHRLSWVVPYALGRWICDRYEGRLLTPVAELDMTEEQFDELWARGEPVVVVGGQVAELDPETAEEVLAAFEAGEKGVTERYDWADDPDLTPEEVLRRFRGLPLVGEEAENVRAAYYQAHRDDPAVWDEPTRREVAYHHRGEIKEGSAVAVEPKRLDTVYSVRFTPEDAAALREAAERRGVTVSDLLRAAARGYTQPSGFTCAHVQVSMGGAGQLTSVSPPCGCQMEPVYAA